MAVVLQDNIFKHIFVHENLWIFIDISLKFIPVGPIDNTPALVQITAWWQTGDKPLYPNQLWLSSLTHISNRTSASMS